MMKIYRYGVFILMIAFVGIGCSGLYAPENASNDQTNISSSEHSNINIRVVSNSVDVESFPSQFSPTATPLSAEVIEQVHALETVFINLYERVKPSVVNIEVVDERSRSDIINSSGSGFVYDIEGHIVTNAHVVLGAREILVTFSQNIVTSAEIVGYDVYSDLAVIKVDVDPNLLIPVTFANSNDVKVGQYIVAIGNPFGLQSSMTTGIVSAIGRILPSQQLINPLTSQVYSNPAIIQIDAAVNPGNSGGPILNLDGQVIGIATAIRSETGLFQGIAYAVPANTIQRIIPQLIETGRAEYSWLGVSTVNNDEPGFSMAALAIELDLPVNYGVLVTQVLRNSPAEAAGLRGGTENVDIRGSTVSVGGDIIIGINGQEIMNLDELLQYLVENTSPGDTVTLTVIRDEQVLEIPVVLGTRPSVD